VNEATCSWVDLSGTVTGLFSLLESMSLLQLRYTGSFQDSRIHIAAHQVVNLIAEEPQ